MKGYELFKFEWIFKAIFMYEIYNHFMWVTWSSVQILLHAVMYSNMSLLNVVEINDSINLIFHPELYKCIEIMWFNLLLRWLAFIYPAFTLMYPNRFNCGKSLK